MKNEDKIQKSKRSALDMLEKLKVFPMLHFRIKIYKICDDTNFGFTSPDWRTLKQIDELKEDINALTADGGTPLWNALYNSVLTMRQIPLENYKMVICITDGDDTSQNKEVLYQKLLESIENQNPQIISIMFFEKNDDRQKLIPKMSELSEKSGAGPLGIGTFTDAIPDDLDSIFEKIVRSITKSYAIYWKSTAIEVGTEVDATLQVEYMTKDHEIKRDEQKFKYILQ